MPSAQAGPEHGRIDGPRQKVAAAAGLPTPVFVYPNFGDHAYAKVALDAASTRWARENLDRISDPLLRQQVWGSLWEMVRDQQLSSLDYLSLVGRSLGAEADLMIVDLVTGTVAGAVSRYVPDGLVEGEAHRFVQSARAAVDAAASGDLKVLWGRALLGQAASPEDARLAAALLDVAPDGFAVDQDMRWSVAIQWSALDLEGAADRVASERVRDRSDRGSRAVITAEAARPDPAVKEEVWERIHNNGYGSLHLAMAAGRGFWQRSQAAILEPYVPRFFEGLPGLFTEWEAEASRAYFRTLFPWHRIDGSLVSRVEALSSRGDLGPMLRRLLIEAGDDLKRALACRAFAAATAG